MPELLKKEVKKAITMAKLEIKEWTTFLKLAEKRLLDLKNKKNE